MRLETITLCAFRGYPQEKTFQFGGSNVLINGPNGSGKSSILDAVEYLLTGNIHRLRGYATEGITENKHYPTRGCDPDDMFIEAEFSGEDGTVMTARRELAGGLTTDQSPTPQGFTDLQSLAEKDLHRLSRADLVSLVLTTPKDRGKRINSLLDVEAINERRKQLRRLERNRFGRELRDTRQQLDSREEQLKRRLGVSELDDTEILQAVNDARSNLGGKPLSEVGDWDDPDFRNDLTGPAAEQLSVFRREDVAERIDDLQEWLQTVESSVAEELQEVDRLVRAIAADEATGDMEHLELLERGHEVIDDQTTECPLCGKAWNAERLKEHIEQRREELDRIARRRDNLQSLQADIDQQISEFTNTATQLISIISEEADDEVLSKIETYTAAIEQLATAVASADEVEAGADPAFATRLESLPSVATDDAINHLLDQIPNEPNQSEMETAWQKLRDTEQDLRAIKNMRAEAALAEKGRDVCREMKQSLKTARDDAVAGVYTRVEDSFAELYGSINPDEKDIDVELNQTDAGVSFRIGFFGEDLHPPQALHSEGHQDIMGLCLFMALTRETSTESERYVLLDDVVMSVDREHLRKIAEILKTTIGQEFQVIITTHDEEWEGILGQTDTVPPENQITLTNWDLDTGPDVQ